MSLHLMQQQQRVHCVLLESVTCKAIVVLSCLDQMSAPFVTPPAEYDATDVYIKALLGPAPETLPMFASLPEYVRTHPTKKLVALDVDYIVASASSEVARKLLTPLSEVSPYTINRCRPRGLPGTIIPRLSYLGSKH
jgi:hypothetical protein